MLGIDDPSANRGPLSKGKDLGSDKMELESDTSFKVVTNLLLEERSHQALISGK